MLASSQLRLASVFRRQLRRVQLAAGVANAAAAGFSGAAEQAALTGQADALQASWERRQDEWTLQKQLADADVAIGQQQVIASPRRAIAGDQAAIASLTQSNAAEAQFPADQVHQRRAVSVDGGVLGGVYRYLLQQAAAVARLAEQQLAFERQAPCPATSRPTTGPLPAAARSGRPGPPG